MKELLRLIENQIHLESEVAIREKKLDELKRDLKNYQENLIPEKANELGINSLELADGKKLSFKDNYYPKIVSPEFYDWMRSNNFGAVIKDELKAEFDKGDSENALAAVRMLADIGISAAIKESVHHSTLKAFVKEQLTDGKPLPESIQVSCIRKSIVK